MERLGGAIELLRDGITGTTTVVERMHFWIADMSYGPVRRVPGVGLAASGSRAGHHGIARLVYGAVRGGAEVTLGACARLARRVGDRRGGRR